MRNDELLAYKARFVNEEGRGSFKYKFNRLFVGVRSVGGVFRRLFNVFVAFWRTNFARVDWKRLSYDFMVWFLEVFVEGLTANFMTHFLFGVRFDVPMIIAHGILIRQGIGVIRELLNKNGESVKLSKEK